MFLRVSLCLLSLMITSIDLSGEDVGGSLSTPEFLSMNGTWFGSPCFAREGIFEMKKTEEGYELTYNTNYHEWFQALSCEVKNGWLECSKNSSLIRAYKLEEDKLLIKWPRHFGMHKGWSRPSIAIRPGIFRNAFNGLCNGKVDAIRQLLPDLTPARTNFKDERGRTMLHHAAEHKEWGLVQALMDKGAEANMLDYYGRCLIDYATEAKQWSLASSLARGSGVPSGYYFVVFWQEYGIVDGRIYNEREGADRIYTQVSSSTLMKARTFLLDEHSNVVEYAAERLLLHLLLPDVHSWTVSHTPFGNYSKALLRAWEEENELKGKLQQVLIVGFTSAVILLSLAWCLYQKLLQRSGKKEYDSSTDTFIGKLEKDTKKYRSWQSNDPIHPITPSELLEYKGFDFHCAKFSRLIKTGKLEAVTTATLEHMDAYIACIRHHVVDLSETRRHEHKARHAEIMKTLYRETRNLIQVESAEDPLEEIASKCNDLQKEQYKDIGKAQDLEKIEENAKRIAKLYGNAVLFKEKFDKFMSTLGDKVHEEQDERPVEVKLANLKGLRRTCEKTVLRPKSGNPWDIVRCQIQCWSASQIIRLLEALKTETQKPHCEFVILQVNNRFEKPTADGWSDVSIYLVSEKDGVVGELQIVHNNMMLVREDLHAHDVYDSHRFIDEVRHRFQADRNEDKSHCVPSGAESPLDHFHNALSDLFHPEDLPSQNGNHSPVEIEMSSLP